jgi:hypothetical protein
MFREHEHLHLSPLATSDQDATEYLDILPAGVLNVAVGRDSHNAVSGCLSDLQKDSAQTVTFGLADVNVVYLSAQVCLGIHSNNIVAWRKAGEREDAVRQRAPATRRAIPTCIEPDSATPQRPLRRA